VSLGGLPRREDSILRYGKSDLKASCTNDLYIVFYLYSYGSYWDGSYPFRLRLHRAGV